MLLSFKEKDSIQIITNLKKAVRKKHLTDKINILLVKQNLSVEINHLGCSLLIFKSQNKKPGHAWKLESKDLALTHQIFQEKAFIYLKDIVKAAGGQVKEV